MPYRQALFQTVLRAKELGIEYLNLGFTADLEKKRLGAKAYQTNIGDGISSCRKARENSISP